MEPIASGLTTVNAPATELHYLLHECANPVEKTVTVSTGKNVR